MFNSQHLSAMPFHFWSLVFFAFGCMVGSFLNVCIYRMPLGLGVTSSPPSHCPHCKCSIPFYLNVPLLSWLSLRGKCHKCGSTISVRYFAVELLTGVAFLACWLMFGHASAWLAAGNCLFLAGLITATFIDFEHFIIPDEITLGGAVAGFGISFFLPQLHGVKSGAQGMVQSLIGIAVGGGIVYAVVRLGKVLFGRQKIKLDADTKIVFTETALCLPDQEIPYEEIFYRKSDSVMLAARTVALIDRSYRDVTVRLTSHRLTLGEEKIDPETVPYLEAVCSELVLPREAMGLGDVKFMAGIGAFLGWQGAVFSLLASCFIGAAVGFALILSRKREWSSRVPYGPYIALAAAIWLFGGKNLFAAFFR